MLGSRKQIKIDPMASPLERLINNGKTIRKDNNIHRNSSSNVGNHKTSEKPEEKTDHHKEGKDVDHKKDESKIKDSTELSEQAVPTIKDQDEGVAEAVKENVKNETQNQQKLDGLLENTRSILFATKNIIPIFKDEIIVDSGKVTVIYRPFFMTEKIHSISIQDITDIYIETVPFLATVKIIDRDYVDNQEQLRTPITIRHLWKGNAEKVRRLVTGLMTASKEGIDLKTISDEDLAKKLEEIGKVKEAKTSVS